MVVVRSSHTGAHIWRKRSAGGTLQLHREDMAAGVGDLTVTATKGDVVPGREEQLSTRGETHGSGPICSSVPAAAAAGPRPSCMTAVQNPNITGHHLGTCQKLPSKSCSRSNYTSQIS